MSENWGPLYIYSSGKRKFVIENKVKDFASIEQMQRIKASCDDASIDYILLTLFWAPCIKFDGWRVLTYRDIATRLKPSNFSPKNYYRHLISDYKNFIENLCTLAEVLPDVTNNYDFAYCCNEQLYKALDKAKFSEGYQRMRASHLVNNYKTMCHKFHVETRVTINNKKATIDFLVRLPREHAICVQVEDDEFRRMVRGNKSELFAQNLLKENLFFDKKYRTKRDNKQFLNYDTTARYQILEPAIDCGISFNELFSKINKVIMVISQNKEMIERAVPR